jgi:hypothetical protein
MQAVMISKIKEPDKRRHNETRRQRVERVAVVKSPSTPLPSHPLAPPLTIFQTKSKKWGEHLKHILWVFRLTGKVYLCI